MFVAKNDDSLMKSSAILIVGHVCHTWLEAASGTVCRPTSPQLQRWLFFESVSKVTSLPNHCLPNCFQFL